MSDPSVVAAAMVTVIAALTGSIVTVIGAWAAARDRRSSRLERAVLTQTTTSTDRKADTLIEKAAEIHQVTNGNLSKVQAELAVANETIRGLEKLLAAQDSPTRSGTLKLVTPADAVTVRTHRRETDDKEPA